MLSRVADSIYWMARYIERAENTARFIDVNLHLNLDLPGDISSQWEPLVRVTGDEDWFLEHYDTPNEENVTQFLTFDERYPHSIMSCLQAARENARSVREIISSEMWEQVNTLYLFVKGVVDAGKSPESLYNFYKRIKMSSCLFFGLMDATMSREEGWHFGKMGQLLERADKTSRILDIKYFILLPSVDDVGTPFDNIQWSALLHSASAFEMYRKRWRTIHHKHVARFLILDADFPRAIYHCLIHADKSLHAISGSPEGTFANAAEKAIGQLRSELAYKHVNEIFNFGLHEFLDHIQLQLIRVGKDVYRTFIEAQALHGNLQFQAGNQQWQYALR